jgi:rhodanese-related sulfurtransferase
MSVAPEALYALLLSSEELALLDVREARQAHQTHLALARHAPLSSLELQIGAFVPRLSTSIVLYDETDADAGPAARAEAILDRLGYRNVRRLRGGLAAWQARALPVIDGYNALVKAFGDLARLHYQTPVLSLDALASRQTNGLPTTLIDARPQAEFAFLSIAGARNLSGTELALAALSDKKSDEKDANTSHLWAINCFSRTRGIIGATTLRLLGRSRNVVFVEDGVMAWGLRGGPVVQNAQRVDDIPEDSAENSRALADGLVARYGLQRIDAETLAHWQTDATRTLYIFDVRPTAATPSHAANGAQGVHHVPGGQLLMHFENLVGTRNARVVLLDDAHGLRAAVTAFWLTQLNQAEVFVLEGALPSNPLPDLAAPALVTDLAPGITAEALASLLRAKEADVVDVGPSLDFEKQHLPGAYFCLPVSLVPVEGLLARGRTVVFTSPDGAAASLAARDVLQRQPKAAVAWLRGGTQAWAGSGQALVSAYGPEHLLTPFDDDGGSVMRVFGPRRDAVWAAYLAWERGVSARIAQDPTVQFRFFG